MTEPIVDIVMLVHRGTWCDLAIRAVEQHTKNPFHLILMGSGVKDPATMEILEGAKKRGHTVWHLAENRSFSQGINAGVEMGTAKYVVILNDDAMVTEGWDSALLQDASEKTVGLVGARSNYVSGAQGDPSFVGEPPWLAFVCVALRREVWEKVGPMDSETFDGFSTEDIDYSWRIVKGGLKLRVSSAFVLHAGSRTLAAMVGDPSERQRNDAKYNRKLVEKWGNEWAAAHSKLRPKILVSSFHAEEWTRVRFAGALVNLKASGGLPFSYYQHSRSPIHFARQIVCNYATDQGYDWLVMIDDDATFPPDLVPRLLAHQKPLVSALAYQRRSPFAACIFEIGEDGLLGAHLEGWERTGLRRVDVTGMHCCALDTNVIRKMRSAGIQQYFGGFENRVGEDFAFCLNMKKIGLSPYCDTGLISGHLGDSIEVNEQSRATLKAIAR